MDPLAERIIWLTTYNYVRNNPINRFDIDGNVDFGSKERLMEVGLNVVNNPNLKSRNGITFCNFGVQEIFHAGGDNSLDNMTANQMYDYLNNPKVATAISYEQAVYYAKQGITTILAWKNENGDHGHVAIVAPKEMEYSGKFKEEVPFIFNIGKDNDIMKASYGFTPLKRPTAFILNKDLQSFQMRQMILTMYNLLGIDESKLPANVWKFFHKAKQDKTKVKEEEN